MTKIDFKNIAVTTLDGQKQPFDISKELGNAIYARTTDLGELELAREIYKNGEVELSGEQVETVKKYLRECGFFAFVQEAVNELLTNKE